MGREGLRASWEGFRASWEGPKAKWEGPKAKWGASEPGERPQRGGQRGTEKKERSDPGMW